MTNVADSPKNRHFEPISGRFTPIRPTNQRCERRAEGANQFLAPGKRGWPPTSPWPLFSRLPPHAPRLTLHDARPAGSGRA